MHIYFSGIGGAGIGPLALLALQAGYKVSGSDKVDSQYLGYLRSKGISEIHVGQTEEAIRDVHQNDPIDWFVYSGALTRVTPKHPELAFCEENLIHTSKRDELLNKIIADKNLNLIAIAGTHGKTTTTAMVVWLFQQVGQPLSFSVGAKTSFADFGHYDPESRYFAYECDEFDRNFLAFRPSISLITGIAWDHHDVFPTEEDYNQAFVEFLGQSNQHVLWQKDAAKLGYSASDKTTIIDMSSPDIASIPLVGTINRQNAYLAAMGVHLLTGIDLPELLTHVGRFPGLSRRFEQVALGIFSDYAHNAEKVRGALETALEYSPNVVVVYEGLHNRRQHFMRDHGQFEHLFDGAKKVYWVPSYLGREDPNLPVLDPKELIGSLHNPEIAESARLDDSLAQRINAHIAAGDIVICMSGGGGESLDEWLRSRYSPSAESVN